MNNDIYINLTLTIEQINNILVALQEIPAKICNPLSQNIHKQVQDQLPKPAEQ